MTYAEAKAKGYKFKFESWQRKYVSRKVNLDDQPVLEAGGFRKGLYYVEAPSWNSTQYSFRIYLEAPKA